MPAAAKQQWTAEGHQGKSVCGHFWIWVWSFWMLVHMCFGVHALASKMGYGHAPQSSSPVLPKRLRLFLRFSLNSVLFTMLATKSSAAWYKVMNMIKAPHRFFFWAKVGRCSCNYGFYILGVMPRCHNTFQLSYPTC